MFVVLGLLVAFGIPAAISAAGAYVLPIFAPGWSLRRRTFVAASAAGLLMIAVPIAAALGDPANPNKPASVMGILVSGLFFAYVAGLPAALFVGRRRGATRINPGTFD